MANGNVVSASFAWNAMEEDVATDFWSEDCEDGKCIFIGKGVLSRQFGDGGIQLFGVGCGLL